MFFKIKTLVPGPGAVADRVLRLDAEEEGGREVVHGQDARLPLALPLLVRQMIRLLRAV
jgi:hypothetical protein